MTCSTLTALAYYSELLSAMEVPGHEGKRLRAFNADAVEAANRRVIMLGRSVAFSTFATARSRVSVCLSDGCATSRFLFSMVFFFTDMPLKDYPKNISPE